jgi:hypothetical protein
MVTCSTICAGVHAPGARGIVQRGPSSDVAVATNSFTAARLSAIDVSSSVMAC